MEINTAIIITEVMFVLASMRKSPEKCILHLNEPPSHAFILKIVMSVKKKKQYKKRMMWLISVRIRVVFLNFKHVISQNFTFVLITMPFSWRDVSSNFGLSAGIRDTLGLNME